MSIKSPLARVKHLGSAKSGTSHFMHQRMTAVFMIPLMVWFIVSILLFVTTPMDELPFFITSGFNLFAAILFIGTMLFHASLGLKVVLEDYIHCKMILNICIGLMYFVCWASLIAGIFSVFSIHILFRTMF